MAYGVLVQRFGGFVRERHENAPAPAEAPRPFPDSLQAEREIIAHHLIPLALLSRADGNYAESEQRVIVDHCLELLERIGVKPSAADRSALEKYIADLRPTLMQLDPALKRLEKETAESLASFLSTARKVVVADGNTDPAETRLLDELRADIANP
jgi:tellurite resistance protein